MSWRILTHHTLKTLLRVVQVVVFIVVPSVIAYLHFVGLPSAFHAPITEAAARAGLELSFSRMRIGVPQGLVLDNVRLNASGLPHDHEIGIDRAAVSLNWRRLARGKVELTALDLRGAQLILPVTSADGTVRELRLTKARARLNLSDGVLSVPLARCNLQGIDIKASGRVLLPPPTPERPRTDPPSLRIPDIGHVLEILDSLDFGEVPPQLEIEFSADASDTASMQVPLVRFTAPRIVRGAAEVRDVRVEASLDAGVATVQQLSARDPRGGLLTGAGLWSVRDGAVEADVNSTLDPLPWLEEFQPAGPWTSLSFDSAPAIQATLTIPPGRPKDAMVIGTVETGDGLIRGVPIGGLSAGVAWREGSFYVSDLSLGLPTGDVRADLMVRAEDFRARIECLADPTPLLGLLDEKVRETVAKMNLDFTDPPEIRLEASGPRADPVQLRATGTLKLGRTSIHDSPMDSATADVSFAERALTLSNIRAVRPEGTATGAFTYDFARNQVRLDGIRSTMNVFNVLQWAEPNVARETIPYRFKSPPEVTAGGTVELKDPNLTRIWANFTAPQGLDYDLLDRTLSFGRATGSLEFAGRKIAVKVPSAALYGGTVALDASITTGEPGAAQTVGVKLEGVNFETLTKLYFDYNNSQGVVSGRYNFTFVPGQPQAMKGSGNLLVQEGNVFAIPVLGPLSVVLDSIVPGTGYQTAREAKCDFKVADGVISTDNLAVVGRGFSMIGQGKIFYLEDRMDFGVRINAQGVPGLLLYPVSKLFEYVSDGKFSDPQWRPRVLPKGQGAKPEKTPAAGRGNGSQQP